LESHVHKYLSTLAAREGLEFLGNSNLDLSQDQKWFEAWLEEGRHAGMGYLAANQEARRDLNLLLAGVQQALVFGLPYDLRIQEKSADSSMIAMYARWRDYHKILKAKLKNLMDSWSADQTQKDLLSGHHWRILVDTAPLLERAVARTAGFGFIGKNTCYIHPKKGSFLLLGEVLTTAPLKSLSTQVQPAFDATKRSKDLGGCGTCRRCQVHCPTGALDADYKIDARRCLSWWTIENRGEIPVEYWPAMKKYWYGCDICQVVCPYNRTSPRSADRPYLSVTMDLAKVAVMSQSDYITLFSGTPMTRAKRSGLRRNALIALYVLQDHRLHAVLTLCENAGDLDEILTATISKIRQNPLGLTSK
jgi:epoxyqueuosine reductase